MPHWRRTLYTIWFTEFIAIVGFAFVTPFIPYYIQQLGVTDSKQVALWAGLAQSGLSLSLAVMAPVWGLLADRYGRKMMVMRATFAGAVLMALMGFVTNVQQLVLLRALQGVFTGTIAAATTLVVSVVPKQHSGAALGSLQTAIFLGATLGPFLGGIMGDTLGYRPSFWITGVLLSSSGVLVLFFVREDFRPAGETARPSRPGLGQLTQFLFARAGAGGALLLVLIARLLLRIGTQTLPTILPLFVQSLLPAEARVATVAGIISGANAVGAAAGSPLIGRWGDRLGHRRLLILSGLGAAALYLPQAFVSEPMWLVPWQLLVGFAIGGTLSTLTALLIQFSPKGREGTIIGLDSSVIALANGIGPMMGAGIAAGWGLSAPFVLASGVMGLGTVVIILWVRERSQQQVGT
jgi:DHA1 family multidrug resistance protein-like MFS transporter